MRLDINRAGVGLLPRARHPRFLASLATALLRGSPWWAHLVGALEFTLSWNPGIPGVGPLAVVHAPVAGIAACGCLNNDGAPARNHSAIMLSKIMQPNAELGMNGQIGLPQR
jgi:hypothetical protein